MRTWYIYEIENMINGNNYIGQRYCPINISPESDTDYMGSGDLIKKAIQKYGKFYFKKKIILKNIFSQEYANDAEKYYIWLAKSINKAQYNICNGGQGGSKPCKASTKQNISKALLLSDKHRKTQDKFLQDSINIWGNLFDYSKVQYRSARQKITIICKKHGEFLVTPNHHLHGQGCPYCGIERMANSKKKFTQETYLLELKNKFKDEFDYSKVQYIDLLHNITLICKKHGEFSIKAGNILFRGCPKCRREAGALKRKKGVIFTPLYI